MTDDPLKTITELDLKHASFWFWVSLVCVPLDCGVGLLTHNLLYLGLAIYCSILAAIHLRRIGKLKEKLDIKDT